MVRTFIKRGWGGGQRPFINLENILYLRDIHRKSHHDKENTAELIAHPIGVISA